MEKKIFILWLALFGLSFVSKAQNGFKITGRLGGTLGGNLVLVANNAQGPVQLGQAVMVNGNFDFSGKVDGMMPAYILTDQQQPVATIMLENTDYTVVAGATGIEVQGGGEAQKIWNEFDAINRLVYQEQMKMQQEIRAAQASSNGMKMQALQEEFQKKMEEVGIKQGELFNKYKDSPVSAFMIATGMEQMDYATLKMFYDGLGVLAKQCLYGQIIARQMEKFKQVEVGAVPADFMGLTAKGDTVSLYGVEAKLKLVDFWASWCAPCRAEMPNVKKVYKKYRGKGLEIIGVSIDKTLDDWTKALQEDKLPWRNIIDPEGKIASYFQVKAIPHTVLLDAENRIIAKDLRGKELENKIAELLK